MNALRRFEPSVDASHVWGPLWQGSWPGEGDAVASAGFDGLVLCAFERQPPHGSFPGVKVTLRVPLDDTEIDARSWRRAVDAARALVKHHDRLDARRFLVTCNMGWNRSGLVNAIAIHLMSGKPGKECVRLVQTGRGLGALSNDSFVRALERL